MKSLIEQASVSPPPAMAESQATEETLSGGEGQSGYRSESCQALARPSPQGCLRYPAGCQEVPRCQTAAEGSARHCEGSGMDVTSKCEFLGSPDEFLMFFFGVLLLYRLSGERTAPANATTTPSLSN